jgi:S-adenosylmethionine synthetase
LLFTSESVSEGHPDKIADQVSDAVLDAILQQDPHARVACECLVTTGLILIAGEFKTNARVEVAEIARKKIKAIGYTSSEMGFDYKSCSVLASLGEQSSDIDQGVTPGRGIFNHQDQGAGDQGLMFGYAVDETPHFMPLSIDLAHQLAARLAWVRKNELLWLRPDGKTQVTVEYEKSSLEGFQTPKRVDTVVVSAQHEDSIPYDTIQSAIMELVIKPILPQKFIDSRTKFLINPTGRFVIGGPQGDCGLTGRKIIVDTYGGHGAHGGGAFSGKDASKVDRSASYMARYVAKNVVAAGLARRCLIQVAYAIGVAEPVSLMVEAFGTQTIAVEEIQKRVNRIFSFKPSSIIERLGLLEPIFAQTATYGHFGRPSVADSKWFTWERLDAVDQLKNGY